MDPTKQYPKNFSMEAYMEVISREKKTIHQNAVYLMFDLIEVIECLEKDDTRFPIIKRELEILKSILIQFYACMKNIEKTMQPSDWTTFENDSEKERWLKEISQMS